MTVEMDDVDFVNYSDSDDGGDEEHKRLLDAISKLDKRKRVLPSERREPSLQVSEFHLAKDSSGDTNAVHLRDLAKSLGVKASHGDLARKLKATQRKARTLSKPLEKPAANKIRREVAYENTTKQLDQWDPIVLSNRVSDNLVFPLKSDKSTSLNPSDFLSPDQGATELEREILAVLNDSPSVQKEREEKEEFPLSLEEMIQRRNELARLKAQESYRHAKAHRQHKIKSKKYHRFARRERIRQQIKEFEELQQKDPEAALQRLEEIEKERVLERASLRHRSTGHWARNQAVRAKYDKESRIVLSEQLKLSKDLTQKIQVESESSDDEPEAENGVNPSDNPWMSQPKTEADIDSFLSGYRQYWAEKGKTGQGSGEEGASEPLEISGNLKVSGLETNGHRDDPKLKALLESAVVSYSEIQENGLDSQSNVDLSLSLDKATSKCVKASLSAASVTSNVSSVMTKSSQDASIIKMPAGKQKKTLKAARKVPKRKISASPAAISSGGKWIVTAIEEPSAPISESLDDMFDDLTEKFVAKAKQKMSSLKKEVDSTKQEKNQSKKKRLNKRKAKSQDKSKLLEMKKQRLQVDLDEKLDEGTGADDSTSNVNQLAEEIKLANSNASVNQKSTKAPELDPNKFMKTGPIKLRTELPDEITGGDEGLDDSDTERDAREKQLTISEAFADDDVVADFSQEKQEAIDKSKPEDISLHLPGWGEWAGHNMTSSKRKRKRFMVKMPEPPPRRDENKGNLFVNESEDSSARVHQVSELPFPFTSVKDYEASVRAPVSNTFIPESAHRKLIKPPVRTKMGAVIEPISKEVLVKHPKNKK